MNPPTFAELTKVVAQTPTQAESVIDFIRRFFPLNMLTAYQWAVLESVADSRQEPLIIDITTFRFCETFEHCSDNNVTMSVTKYLEVNPFNREIKLKKTVRIHPSYINSDIYLKSYSMITKIE